MHLTRRGFGQALTAIALVGRSRGARAADPSGATGAAAGGTTVSHGISAFGDLKYPPGFSHFDYADPSAPTGGTRKSAGGSVYR